MVKQAARREGANARGSLAARVPKLSFEAGIKKGAANSIAAPLLATLGADQANQKATISVNVRFCKEVESSLQVIKTRAWLGSPATGDRFRVSYTSGDEVGDGPIAVG
jgi:hypothetical protein